MDRVQEECESGEFYKQFQKEGDVRARVKGYVKEHPQYADQVRVEERPSADDM
jgi:hypothetical protein